jgi:hypothetical protein
MALTFSQGAGGGGWTATQIAVPIVTGLGVAIFLWYRKRKQDEQSRYSHSRSSSGIKQPWRDANLRGRRRFLGLFPVRYKVQPRPRSDRGDSWSIDDPTSTVEFAYPDSSRTPSRMTDVSIDLGPRAGPTHSRDGSESRTSLISSTPSQRSKQTIFSAFVSRISGAKAYQSGTTKGSDYRRVNVVPLAPYQSFRIDGSDGHTSTDSRGYTNGVVVPETPPSHRQNSFPSVLDIRRETPIVDSRHATQTTEPLQTPPSAWGTRNHQWNSEYSLGSSDYVTPSISESPTSSFHPVSHSNLGDCYQSGLGLFCLCFVFMFSRTDLYVVLLLQHRLNVNAASPLLARNQLPTMAEETTDSPFALPFRNPSRDSMEYEVYPREPRAY